VLLLVLFASSVSARGMLKLAAPSADILYAPASIQDLDEIQDDDPLDSSSSLLLTDSDGPRGGAGGGGRRGPPAPAEPCTDYGQPIDKRTLVMNWPALATVEERRTPAPWDAHVETKVFKSASLNAVVTNLLAAAVPGLENRWNDPGRTDFVNQNYGQVFQVFRDEGGCLMYLHGGSVRDFFLKAPPKDIDVEYSCAPARLRAVCLAHWGPAYCFGSGTVERAYFRIGPLVGVAADLLEGTNWAGSSFINPIAKEFTTNALSFDLNDALAINWLVIDTIGSGVYDTCHKYIHLTVRPPDWDKWLFDWKQDIVGVKRRNGFAKVPRFFKLLVKGYTATPGVNAWFVNKIKRLWGARPDSLEATFRVFFCAKIVRGTLVKDGGGRNAPIIGCTIDALTQAMMTKIQAYNTAFKTAMNDDPWFLQYVTTPGVNKYTLPQQIAYDSYAAVAMRAANLPNVEIMPGVFRIAAQGVPVVPVPAWAPN